jgi:hypothetical protein
MNGLDVKNAKENKTASFALYLRHWPLNIASAFFVE